MRTTPHTDRILYNWITVREAAKQLGGLSDEHVIALGRNSQLRITDLRQPGAKRGIYRVDPKSVQEFLESRLIGDDAAA